MPIYIFKAKDAQGKNISNRIVANDQQDAIAKLRQDYALILSLKETKETRITTKGGVRRGKSVKIENLAQFSRELATMVGNGVPLVKSLSILSKQFKEKTLSGIAKDLSVSIESGSSFAEGLSKHPGVFSSLYVNMVAAGESSGMLNKILERLAVYLEKTAMLVRKVKTAMIYPVAVIVVALLITTILMLKVIPSFKSIFDSIGGELPLPTQIVLGISFMLKRFFILILGAIVGLAVFINRYIQTPKGRLMFDHVKLNMPVLGPLFQKFAIARFSRTFATLLRGGVPILDALNTVSKAIGNKILEEAILRAKENVRRGQRLALELEKEKYFPPMVVEMIGTGEETGELDTMLDKIAESYEEQVDIAAAGIVAMVEPFIIIFLGIVVGGIVIAMFLPILKITQIIGR